MTRPHLLDALRDRVLLCDGGMGSRVQALTLDVEKDYWDRENCTEVLNLSRPDMVREIHRGYFAAGADMVETNSFGGSPITLAEFDLEDRTHEINRVAAELAREAADSFADGRHRWVLGSIGPGTKLPSLGNIAYDPLEAALAAQSAGLIDGGVDAILIETCQDTLQIKAAVNGAKIARAAAGTDTPIFVQVTVETTGTLLVGPDIAAAATVIHALDVPLVGLNCATGPQEMAEHVRWLAANWPGLLSIQPNAGLPELVNGATHYPLGAAEMASWVERFVLEDGLNLVGGCCGTSIPHIEALDAMLRKLGGPRPAPVPRSHHWVPSVASLYGQTPLRQENSYFSIGERCNANGSKKWRELQERGDWDGCVAVGREQVGEGSNSLDICTAFVGRDEVYEMNEVITRFTSSVNAPLVIDSTETNVIEAALKLHGGKPIINSINFEDGEDAARDRLLLARKFGAAVIALTIDETGMAKQPEEKLRGGAPPGGVRLRQARPAAERPDDRPADLHGRDRQRGRPQARPVDAGGHRRDPPRVPGRPDHAGPVQHLLRAQRRRPRGAEQRVPGPRGARRHDRRHRAREQDPAAAPDRARGGAGLRGPALRPPAGGLRPAAEAAGAVRRPQGRRRDQEGAQRDRRRVG